jgi:hypothetical protein
MVKLSDIAGTRKIIQAAYKVLEASAIKSTGYELDVLIVDNEHIDELILDELERAMSFIKSGEHNKPPEHSPEPPWEPEQVGKLIVTEADTPLCEQCHEDLHDELDVYTHAFGEAPWGECSCCGAVKPEPEPEPLFPPELAAQADQDVIDRNGWEHPCDDGHEHDDCLHCGAILVNEHPEQLCGNCYHDEHPTEPNYEQLGEVIEERERFLYEETGSSNEPKNCEQLERNICDHSFTYYDNSTNESYCSECGNWFRGDRLV